MKIAINGMGRIGRAALKAIQDYPELEVVAVNDIAPIDNIAYLLNYDTVYGIYEHKVTHDEDSLSLKEKKKLSILREIQNNYLGPKAV